MRGSRQAKYHGLVNQGATCYLNSVLQVLFMTGRFRDRVKSYSSTNAGTEHIDSELRDLFSSLEKSYTHTRRITNKLRIRDVREHRDAAEQYEKILRLTSPDASEIFHGELINRNKCCECNTETKSAAGFWHLPLPLVSDNSEYSVKKGLKDFFQPSMITGDDQMYCENCDKKCDAVLDCVVKHYPEVLVLLLKRFEIIYDGSSVRKVKINCPVKIPDTLQKETIRYELYAFVEHFGDLQYGHYNAKIKSLDEGLWYIFDDLNVEESNYQHFQVDPTETSKHVYLLFYQQKKGDTNNAPPDTCETLPATVTNRTKDTLSTEEENNKTEATSAFSKGFGAPVRYSLERGAISDSKVQRPGVYDSDDKTRETKSVKDEKNKKHEPSQDVRDKRLRENVHQYEVSYNSAFLNHTDEVIIKMPVETEETSEGNKRLRQDFDKKVKGRNYVAKSPSRSRSPLSNLQWQQSAQSGYQSGQASPVKNKGEQRHVSQHLDRRESRQNDVQVHPAANRHDAVHRSSSFAPTRSSSSMYGNGTRHHSTRETEERMRSEESYVPSGEWDRGRPGSERFGRITPKERHSFHGQHQNCQSQDYHLGKFEREKERNYERTEWERRGTQNYNYKGQAGVQSHREVVHSQPLKEKPQPHRTPQQCLERAEQKKMRRSHLSSRESLHSARLQKPRSGRDDGFTTGRPKDVHDLKSKSTNYSPPIEERSFRIQPYGNTKPGEEITVDSLDEVNLTSKSTIKGQTLNQYTAEMMLDTNDQKTEKKKKKKKTFLRKLFSCIPFKRKDSK